MGGADGQTGAIILARHGKPALSRRAMLSSDGYRIWWTRYEAGGLGAEQVAPEAVKIAARDAGVVVASTRLRSVESARAACGDRAFIVDPLFVEAPLPPPPWPGWIRLPPVVWGFISRTTWWFLDLNRGEESRRQAEARAEAAAGRLVELASGGADVLLLAHGFFNAMIARVLRRQGWRCTQDGGYAYWSVRRFELRR
jgi:broad specificity phosphatase PhoE